MLCEGNPEPGTLYPKDGAWDAHLERCAQMTLRECLWRAYQRHDSRLYAFGVAAALRARGVSVLRLLTEESPA